MKEYAMETDELFKEWRYDKRDNEPHEPRTIIWSQTDHKLMEKRKTRPRECEVIRTAVTNVTPLQSHLR